MFAPVRGHGHPHHQSTTLRRGRLNDDEPGDHYLIFAFTRDFKQTREMTRWRSCQTSSTLLEVLLEVASTNTDAVHADRHVAMPYDWYPFSTVASLFSLLVRKVRELNKLRLFDDTYSIWESEDPCNCLGALCHRYLCLAGAKEKKLLHVAVLGYRGRRDLVNQSSLADAAQKYARRKYDSSPGYAGRAALVTPVCDQPRSQDTPQKKQAIRCVGDNGDDDLTRHTVDPPRLLF